MAHLMKAGEQSTLYIDKIKDCFQSWVEQINILVAEKKLSIEEKSNFINFNYTSTLQIIYKIKDENILHTYMGMQVALMN